MDKKLIQLSVKRIAETKRKLGELKNPVAHICHSFVCDPCNEAMMIAAGKMSGSISKVGKDVYVCNYRTIHVCTQNTCTATEGGVCRISGACYGVSGLSSYDSGDYRTWKTKTMSEVYQGITKDEIYYDDEEKLEESTKPTVTVPQKRKKKHESKISISEIRKVVDTLLYSPKKPLFNKNRLQTANLKRERLVNAYKAECRQKKIPVNLVHIHLLELSVEDPLFVETDPYDLQKVEQYTSLAYQFCKLVKKYSDHNVRICVKSITIALLYTMTRGYTVDNEEYIAVDEYVRRNLPLSRDLSKLGFERKQLTKGDQLLSIMFERAKPSDFKFEMLKKSLNGKQDVNILPANHFKIKRLRKELNI